MGSAIAIPFHINHLHGIKPEKKYRSSITMALISPVVRGQMHDPYSVTFIDAKNLEVLGCFGVLPSTNECWMILAREGLDREGMAAHRRAIARMAIKILDAREERTGEPSLARVDEPGGREEKLLLVAGFQKIDEEWYKRGQA